MSYFLTAGAPRSPAATLTTRYGKAERADDLLLDREQPVVLVARRLRLAEDEQLDLVELVHAEHPARVLAGRARLAPEAGRERGVAERQLVEDLVHVEAGERDLGRTGQVEVVVGERVDVRALGGEEAGAVHRLLADEHRREHRDVPVRHGRVDREAVERRARAGRCRRRGSRSASRRAARRAPSRSGRSRCARGRAGPGSPTRRSSSASSSVSPSGEEGSGGFGTCSSRRSRSASAAASSSSAALSSSFTRFSSSSCGRRRLALQLQLAAQLVRARDELAPALVGREQRVEGLRGALARERGAEAVGIVARRAEVDHATESRASATEVVDAGSLRAARSSTGRSLALDRVHSTAPA